MVGGQAVVVGLDSAAVGVEPHVELDAAPVRLGDGELEGVVVGRGRGALAAAEEPAPGLDRGVVQRVGRWSDLTAYECEISGCLLFLWGIGGTDLEHDGVHVHLLRDVEEGEELLLLHGRALSGLGGPIDVEGGGDEEGAELGVGGLCKKNILGLRYFEALGAYVIFRLSSERVRVFTGFLDH